MFSIQGKNHLLRSQRCACFPWGELCVFTAFPWGLIHANGALPTPHGVKSSKIRDLDHNLGMHHRGLQIWGIFQSTLERDGSLGKKIKQLAPCLALSFLVEADVWLKGLGWKLCTRDMKITERREAHFQIYLCWILSIFAWGGGVTRIIISAKCCNLLILWQTYTKQTCNRKSVTFFFFFFEIRHTLI